MVFKSHKSHRVVRSAMADEVIAFIDMVDVAVTHSSELQCIKMKPVPLHLLTENKALFDIIATGYKTSEKGVMLDIATAQEGFSNKFILILFFST